MFTGELLVMHGCMYVWTASTEKEEVGSTYGFHCGV
jgi:hypothetical protein